MTFTLRRTAAAFLLTTAAVGLPSLAWYLAGTHSVEKEIRLMEQAAETEALAMAQRLADNVATRLNALRRTEDNRPFYQYQSLCHDPKGAYDGPSIVPSPLADGPSDPLVWAHFQMNPGGRLTLPTLNDVDPDITPEAVRSSQQAALKSLSRCESFCEASLKEMEHPVRHRRPSEASPGATPPQEKRTLQALGESGQERKPRVVEMDRAAWLQNQQAGRLYADLKGIPAKGGCALADRSRLAELAARKGKVKIIVGPFRWRTLPIDRSPALAALRIVEAPEGGIVQGFVVTGDAVDEWLNNQEIPARLVPAGSTGRIEAPLPIQGADWAIAVESGPQTAGRAGKAAALRSRFQREFWLFSLGAWIVGLSVVGLVWQAGEGSNQRSRFAASAGPGSGSPLSTSGATAT